MTNTRTTSTSRVGLRSISPIRFTIRYRWWRGSTFVPWRTRWSRPGRRFGKVTNVLSLDSHELWRAVWDGLAGKAGERFRKTERARNLVAAPGKKIPLVYPDRHLFLRSRTSPSTDGPRLVFGTRKLFILLLMKQTQTISNASGCVSTYRRSIQSTRSIFTAQISVQGDFSVDPPLLF